MIKLPKHLEEMQDELARKYTNSNYLYLNKDSIEDYQSGFNQAATIMLKDMEEMAKALEEIAEMTYDSNLSWGGRAKDALKNYREKYGVE